MMQLYNYNPITITSGPGNSGQPLPTAVTIRMLSAGPGRSTTYGNIRIYSKLGFSNFNGIQLEAEKRYSQRLAFPGVLCSSNSTSTGGLPSQGGDFTARSGVYQPTSFFRELYHSDLHDRIKFLRYQRDMISRNTAYDGTSCTTCR